MSNNKMVLKMPQQIEGSQLKELATLQLKLSQQKQQLQTWKAPEILLGQNLQIVR